MRRERVVWELPVVAPATIEHKTWSLRDITQILETDANHPVSQEVAKLIRIYRDALVRGLEQLERASPKGGMPQVQLGRSAPRWPIEHVAQHCFATIFYEVIVDATEEDRLINAPPGKDTPE